MSKNVKAIIEGTKIDKRKKYFLVVDVESTGQLGTPKIYDLGFVICDRKGRIYEERSFVIQEIFDNTELMESAFFSNKIPQYHKEIKSGQRQKVSWNVAREEMLELMRKYNVASIAAYNLAFDRRALSHTHKFLTGNDKFLTSEFKHIEQLCIWSFACEVLYTRPSFQKVAIEQQWVSPKGNLKTNAEVGYRYLSKNYEFIEAHTGLEDVRIECYILSKCIAQHQKHESGILSNPWRIPNKIRQEREIEKALNE